MPDSPHTADIVERLGYHHEHPVTGKLVLCNPDGPEAAAEIKALRELLLQARHHVVFTIDVDPKAGDLANEIDAALANAAPAQVESGE